MTNDEIPMTNDQNSLANSARRGPRKRVIIPLIILLLCVAVGYGYWHKYLREYVSTDDAYVEADRINISSTILGRIIQLMAEEGDTVQSGQLLVQLDQDTAQLFAPFSGIVARRWVMQGEVVQPGQPILTIYDYHEIWVRANLEETKIHRIKMGDPVHVTIDASKDQVITGKVVLIGSVASSLFSLIPPHNASGNFTKVTQRIPVKITLDSRIRGNDTLELRPGTSAVVKIHVKGR